MSLKSDLSVLHDVHTRPASKLVAGGMTGEQALLALRPLGLQEPGDSGRCGECLNLHSHRCLKKLSKCVHLRFLLKYSALFEFCLWTDGCQVPLGNGMGQSQSSKGIQEGLEIYGIKCCT